MTQLGIFEARAQRDSALSRVEAGAGSWVDEAFTFVAAYARTHAEVFVDDLWAAGLPRPSNPKALGPVMVRAAKAGLMESTGSWRRSVSSRMSVKPVWRSRVYRGTP